MRTSSRGYPFSIISSCGEGPTLSYQPTHWTYASLGRSHELATQISPDKCNSLKWLKTEHHFSVAFPAAGSISP